MFLSRWLGAFVFGAWTGLSSMFAKHHNEAGPYKL